MNSIKRSGARVAGETKASTLTETLVRLGYIVRGLLYGVMGLLALQVALSRSGTLADTQGAIATVGKTPLGGILLIAILIGLIGYSLWGFIRAVFDPLHKGSDAKGLAARLGYVGSGVTYAFLAFATYRLITGGVTIARGGAQTAQTRQAAASILSYSWGPFVVGIAAGVLMGGGILQIVQGLRGDFDQLLQPYTGNKNTRTWVYRLGRFGTVARGVVFTLVGLFLFLAAYYKDASQAQGIDGALASLLHQPYGPWLLGIVALGLIAFGIFSAMCGFWLRLKR